MARGRISGNKIYVSGFRANDTEHEETYRVSLSGSSTVGSSRGAVIRSNTVVIRHEKHAYVNFGGQCQCDIAGCATELCGCVVINAKNIKPNSVKIIASPSFVNTYEIERKSNSEYHLKYCLYPDGSASSAEAFVVGGTDIYGNAITSGEYYIEPPVVEGTGISLKCSTGNTTTISAPYSSTSWNLKYQCEQGVIYSTVKEYEKTGDITNVTFSGRNDDQGYGYVKVEFLENQSRNSTKTYKIRICGKDKYGQDAKSNYVTIVQEKKPEDGQLYITGDDISYDQTVAVFVINYSSNMTDIEITNKSTNLGTPVTASTGTGKISVSATTDVNEGTERKALSIYVRAKSPADGYKYADKTIYQSGSAYLLILGRCTGNKTGSVVDENTVYMPVGNNATNYCSTLVKVTKSNTDVEMDSEIYPSDESTGYEHYTGDPVPYYTQTVKFKYMSNGVTGIHAVGDTAFRNVGGQAQLNSTSKEVTLSFPQNKTGAEREFTITVSGTSSNNNTLSATYTFKQLAQTGPAFLLLSGTTGQQSATLSCSAETISLTITCPSDYKDIAVGEKTSSDPNYEIGNVSIVKNNDEKYSLTGTISQNVSSDDVTYNIIASGHTGNNEVKFTNYFTITQNH